MKWELRLSRDGFSIDAAKRKGRALPDWYLKEPPVHPNDIYYFQWFWKLNSCRNYEFGPIPYDKVIALADRVGLDEPMIDLLNFIIESMDAEYLKWQIAEAKKRNESGGK